MSTVSLLCLPLFLHCTFSLPHFEIDVDRYLELAPAEAPITSTPANNPFIDRVSHRKCQEYIVKSLTNTFYAEDEAKVTSKTISSEVTLDGPHSDNKKPVIPVETKINTEKETTEDVTNLDPEISLPDEPIIAGGKDSILGEFPHMAAIGWLNADGNSTFDCGGTLISPRFVLTAAHCTYSHVAEDPAPKFVRFGDLNIDSSVYDAAHPMQINIKTIHNHPQYTRKKNYNDIALLELDSDVYLNVLIAPACLWSSSDFGEYTEATAIGWGVVDPYTNMRSNVLQKVTLPLLSNEVCGNLLVNHINRKWKDGFRDTQLCAGETEGGKDTCQGDSGSPLQIQSWEDPREYFVIGITSFGPKFCAQLPAVYTRVSSYLDWIESVVWPEEYKAWLNSSTHS